MSDSCFCEFALRNFDLGGDDTIRPVTTWLEERAFRGDPLDVDVIYVHTANAATADGMIAGLIRYGYNAKKAATDQLLSAPVP